MEYRISDSEDIMCKLVKVTCAGTAVSFYTSLLYYLRHRRTRILIDMPGKDKEGTDKVPVLKGPAGNLIIKNTVKLPAFIGFLPTRYSRKKGA